MVLIDYVNPTDVDGKARELLDRDTEIYGHPSLFAMALATDPDGLEARQEYQTSLVHDGEIDSRICELVYLAVSVSNDCEYCVASHRAVLVEQMDVPDSAVDALARDELSPFEAEERAAIEFAKQVARNPKEVDESHLETLYAAGFDDKAVIRLLLIATAAISANAIADSLHIDPSDKRELLG